MNLYVTSDQHAMAIITIIFIMGGSLVSFGIEDSHQIIKRQAPPNQKTHSPLFSTQPYAYTDVASSHLHSKI